MLLFMTLIIIWNEESRDACRENASVLYEEPMIPERYLREGEKEGKRVLRGLEGVQQIEKLQLIIFVPTGNQQTREVVLAQAHLRRLRYFRQIVRYGGWHATRRSLIQGIRQTAGGRRAAAAGLKNIERHRSRYRCCRCCRRRCRSCRHRRRSLRVPSSLRDRGTAPGPFAFLHSFEIQLPEATFAWLVFGTWQLQEALVQREIVSNRVLFEINDKNIITISAQ